MIKRSFPSIHRLGVGAAIAPTDSSIQGNTTLLVGLGVVLVGLVSWALYSDYRNVQSLTPADRADLLKKRALYSFGNEAIRDLND